MGRKKLGPIRGESLLVGEMKLNVCVVKLMYLLGEKRELEPLWICWYKQNMQFFSKKEDFVPYKTLQFLNMNNFFSLE